LVVVIVTVNFYDGFLGGDRDGFSSYSSPKSFMRKIGLRLRSANDIRWLSEAMH
jgi:hypothetical protein